MAIDWSGGPPPGRRPRLATDFYRSQWRVLVLAFLACVFLVQRAANDYLKAKYPQAVPQGVTWGETLATGLGILVFGLVALDWLVPNP